MENIVKDFTLTNGDFGQKGNNLKELFELFFDDKEIIVPNTMVLTKSIYKAVMRENGKSNFSCFNNIIINPQMEQNIVSDIREVFGLNKLVIRSSATCEDSIFFSGSGQYDSFLNINEDKQILDAIRKIYASFHSKNSQIYSKIYGINLKDESMAILIQKVAPVIKSGVMFSCDPVDGKECIIIESTKGLGTNVVEGIGDINYIEVKNENLNEFAADSVVGKLITCCKRIKEHFGYEVDVEWGIDDNNNIYIFQTRPIILKKHDFEVEYESIENIFECTTISKGFTIGRISNISNPQKGTILYQDEKFAFNDLELLLEAKAVILKEKSKLSHFANILRELKKPCVQINNFNFNENDIFIIDGYNSKIVNFSKIANTEKVEKLFNLIECLKSTYNDSFEKYNGILNIETDNKLEQVVFGINEKRVLKSLKEKGFKKHLIKQGIYTYDLPNKELITEQSIFRIQITNKRIVVQLKKLYSKKNKYREERGYLINFDSLINAKKFIKSLGMEETGYQERKIVCFKKMQNKVNLVKWPNSEPYLGIEVLKQEDFSEIAKELEIQDCEISGMSGKEIFERLNLTLNNCEFKTEEK